MANAKIEDNRVASFLSRNATFTETHKPAPSFAKLLANPPIQPRIMIISCFDGRADPRQFLGLQPGDAIVISNAGGRVSPDVLRSLIVLDDLLVVGKVIVVHHTDCGVLHTSDESIPAKLKERAQEKAEEIEGMGFGLFKDMRESVRHDMGVATGSPYLDFQVLGYIYDVTHGAVEEVNI